MSADILEANKREEMEKESSCDGKKMDPQIRLAAGVKTHIVDENQFQRRHFSHKTSSNIFFCDLPPDQKSSANNLDQDELNMPVETEICNDDEKQSEKLQFHLPLENNAEPEEQVDSASAEIIESTEIEEDNADEIQSEMQDLHLTSEDSADQDEQVDTSGTIESTETETSNSEEDQSKTQRRHFHQKNKSNIFFCG